MLCQEGESIRYWPKKLYACCWKEVGVFWDSYNALSPRESCRWSIGFQGSGLWISLLLTSCLCNKIWFLPVDIGELQWPPLSWWRLMGPQRCQRGTFCIGNACTLWQTISISCAEVLHRSGSTYPASPKWTSSLLFWEVVGCWGTMSFGMYMMNLFISWRSMMGQRPPFFFRTVKYQE